jgi:hypothetical protein
MKMKLIPLFIGAALFSVLQPLPAQTNTFPKTGAAGIGTTAPGTSSLLEIKSTSKGILIPRMTLVQRNGIVAPATGLLIFQTNSTPGFYYYTGSAWKAVTSKTGWSLTGNAGTSPSTNFIGTTDAAALVFKVNNTQAGLINGNDSGTAFGYQALQQNSGIWNTAIGFSAMAANTTGIANTAIGDEALVNNVDGRGNIAVGASALFSNSSGSDNAATGYAAIFENTSGGDNTAYGFDALYSNSSGSYNTGIGYNALVSTTASEYNTAIGYDAGSGNDNGYNNVFCGANTGANATGYYNMIAIGQDVICTAPSQAIIGNSSTNSIGGYVNWTNISDGRVKKNIEQNVPGLAFINKLAPITYNLDLDAADNIIQPPQRKDATGKLMQPTPYELEARKAKEQVIYTGFVAQEVEKAAKSLNYDFSGVDAAKNDKDLYGLRYAEFVVPLVKAVQELSKMNDEKDSIINNLEMRLARIESLISTQQLTVNNQPVNSSSAFLEQNIPNPFSNSTLIKYSLPPKYASAKIIITDKNGKTLKEENLAGNGQGSISVNAATLASGAYQYSLYVDEKLVSTKQMILAK